MEVLSLFKKRVKEPVVAPAAFSLYTTCEKLPMSNFIACLCDDNFRALVIEGYPSLSDLKEAWTLILSEYYELTHSSIVEVEHLRLRRDITVLHTHLEVLSYAKALLESEYRQASADMIRELGYKFNPVLNEDPFTTDPSTYQAELNVISAKSKKKYILLQQAQKQLIELQAKAILQKKPERKYFTQSLLNMEEMQGVSYDMDTLTVEKYVSLEKKYQQKIDSMKQINSKAR